MNTNIATIPNIYLKMADQNNIDMAQVEQLHLALQQSFSPDGNVRDPAEASIKQLKFVPKATAMLLHITEEKQVRKLLSH